MHFYNLCISSAHDWANRIRNVGSPSRLLGPCLCILYVARIVVAACGQAWWKGDYQLPSGLKSGPHHAHTTSWFLACSSKLVFFIKFDKASNMPTREESFSVALWCKSDCWRTASPTLTQRLIASALSHPPIHLSRPVVWIKSVPHGIPGICCMLMY